MMDRIFHFAAEYLPAFVTPPVLIGLLVALALSVVAGLSAWLWWRHRRRTRFIPRFGVLWDKKHTPFCPTCRAPLGNWSSHSSWKFERRDGRTLRLPTTYQAFDCPQCTRPVRLVDHDGYEMTLEQALAQLQPPNAEE